MTSTNQQYQGEGDGGQAADAPAGPAHPSLAELAECIRTSLRQGGIANRRSLEHYRDAGQALIRAKEIHGEHGHWLRWLPSTGVKQQRASEYVRLAEGWDELPPGGDLSLKEALEIISGGEDGGGESEPAAENSRPVKPSAPRPTAARTQQLPPKVVLPTLRNKDQTRFPRALAALRKLLRTKTDGDTLREAVYWCYKQGVTRA